MHVFANGKWRFHPFIEFYVIHVKKRGKNLIIVALKLEFSRGGDGVVKIEI